MDILLRHPATVVFPQVWRPAGPVSKTLALPVLHASPVKLAPYGFYTQECEEGGRHGHTARTGYCRHSDKMKGFDVTTPLLPAGNDDCDCDGSSTPIGTERQTRKTRVERDVEENRGRGCYSLHAVLGQGSFGRIHLASWRGFEDANGGVVDGTPTPRFHDVITSSSRPLNHHTNRNRNGSSTDGNSTLGSLLSGRRRRQRQPSPTRTWNLRIPLSPSTFVKPHVGGDEPAKSDSSRSAGEGRGERVGSVDGSWKDSGGGESIRLRAVKSVCKRKITEKGLMNHMETVRDEGKHPVANRDCRLLPGR